MASSSENQGLQIAVIIFALLTIIMSGATFYVFKLSEDSALRAVEANKQAGEAKTALTAALAEMDEYRRMMGTPYAAPNMKIEDAQAAFKTDMETHANTFPEDKRTYSDALAELKTAYNALNQELSDERKKVVQLDADVKQATQLKNEQIQTHRQEAETAQQEKKEATTKFSEDRTKLNTDRTQLATEMQSVRAEYDEFKNKSVAAAKKADDSLAQMRDIKEGVQTQLDEVTKKTFVTADGEIQWVSPHTKTVWINLGRDDGLVKQVTFSVFGTDQNGVARSEAKASIEVTKILGPHLAEARIVEDSLPDPILIRDQLYTPLWHPGRQEQFAICGMIDIDKDGVSDASFVKDMIKRQGGTWVAELLPDGAVGKQGEGMTVYTRYLIKGEPFPGTEEPYGAMEKEAIKLGVEVLTLEKFLDYVGFKESSKVVNFGRNAKPEDFLYNPNQDKARRPAPNSAGGSNFRPRAPSRADGTSAY